MATSSSVVPADSETTPTRSRIPLSPRTSSLSQSPVKVVRRKSSFIRRADSSEGPPSSHGSIYEALYFSNTNSEDINSGESWPLQTLQNHPAPILAQKNNENSRISQVSTIEAAGHEGPFIYGRGTVLDTIQEKNSTQTIRTLARPKSLDDIHRIPFFNHRDSFCVAKSPRRKLSFSVDDLNIISSSYHEAIATIEGKASESRQLHEIYAEPKLPIQEPPNRPPTPPGMPSWTAHQNLPTRSRNRPIQASRTGTQNRLQRFFGLPASRFQFSSSIPDSNGRVRSVSAPAGPAAPRFRPPRSAYGAINQHPFNRAPIAKVHQPPVPAPNPVNSAEPSTQINSRFAIFTRKHKSDRKVRFTPSTAGQDCELRNPLPILEPPTTPRRSVLPLPAITQHTTISSIKSVGCPHGKTRRKWKKAFHGASFVTPPRRDHSLSNSTPETLASPPRLLHPLRDHSPSRPSAFSPPSSPFELEFTRSFSFSSSTNLMSSGLAVAQSPSLDRSLLAPSPTSSQQNLHSEHKCWRCKLDSFSENLLEKGSQWLKETRSCLCFVCCGYDYDEDSRAGSALGGRYVSVESPSRTSVGYLRQRDMMSSRRGISESTPVVL